MKYGLDDPSVAEPVAHRNSARADAVATSAVGFLHPPSLCRFCPAHLVDAPYSFAHTLLARACRVDVIRRGRRGGYTRREFNRAAQHAQKFFSRAVTGEARAANSP
ncbi:hypothetical protein [Paraburkholderia sp. Ac-20347]|uniref:hypothetical protein n=1 Tax=Paraburkholderia sp. Ac-20347 TaxID=2703892 RepID=UPI00197F2836|nr:hypothetical protein [Paraburkholderia sp. Ac-20347]MBN3811841.1 hypothetical protein [Paraburkholderia sp. Ac-20347]